MCENDAIYETLKIYHKNRDHCHITGKFRGATHIRYNLNDQVSEFYPVVIHNFAGCDAHLFFKNLSDNVRCIPNIDEKCI